MKTEAGSTTWRRLVGEFAQVGNDLSRLEAAEGAAGNLSVFVRRLTGLPPGLKSGRDLPLPVAVPALAGGWIVVTGAGKRLRDIDGDPLGNLCVLHIKEGGRSAGLHAAQGLRPTSELNSHLAVHNDHVLRWGLSLHAIVHAQPPFLTYLSHHPAYQDQAHLNRHLMRWEPETMMAFPEGITSIAFEIPGSEAMMRSTIAALEVHRLVVWQKHGVMARSDAGLAAASDLVEYAEAAARLEFMNLQIGEPSEGILPEEMRKLREAWGIH